MSSSFPLCFTRNNAVTDTTSSDDPMAINNTIRWSQTMVGDSCELRHSHPSLSGENALSGSRDRWEYMRRRVIQHAFCHELFP
jgi:hypothetical protein